MSTIEQQAKARQDFYREQQKNREDFYGHLGKFAEKTLDEKRSAKVNARSEPQPPPAKVERRYTTLSTPARAIKRPEKKTFRQVDQTTSASSALSGAFFTLYVVAFGANAGDTMLQGGSVTGGNGGTATIADEKVIDASTGPAQADGTILYLRAACTATVEDGVMLPGCLLTGASTSLQAGSTIPDNHAFTVAVPLGYVYVEIGRWANDLFYPSAPGNILASGCIGNFHLSRA